MGYGFPAAIGAQIAFPGKTVIDIAGDGSIQMNIQELATAVEYKLPVKVAILNNRFLGMVRQWQEFFYGKRYSHSCIGNKPDFVKVAEAYGGVGLRAEKPKAVTLLAWEGLNGATAGETIRLELREADQARGHDKLAVNLFIGPEGGFTEEEVELAESLGATIFGLGPRTLRAETAALAAVSLIQYEIGGR